MQKALQQNCKTINSINIITRTLNYILFSKCVYMFMSEDTLQELVFSLHSCVFRDWTLSLDGRHLYPLSHNTSPNLTLTDRKTKSKERLNNFKCLRSLLQEQNKTGHLFRGRLRPRLKSTLTFLLQKTKTHKGQVFLCQVISWTLVSKGALHLC